MHYLALDTNTWIYLANGTEPVRLLNYIKSEVEKQNITVLLPASVVQEWNKHKADTTHKGAVQQGAKKFFQDGIEGLAKVKMLLEDKANSSYSEFADLEILFGESIQGDGQNSKKEVVNLLTNIEALKGKIKSHISEAITDNINLIDSLFSHKTTIDLPENELVNAKCIEFGKAKKAPLSKKSSVADALIIFSFLEYVKANGITGAMFVSYNTEDFCQKEHGKNKLHPDLVPEFGAAKAEFFTTLAEAIRPIEDFITQREMELIASIKAEIENDIIWCQVCDEMAGRGNEVYFEHIPHELADERAHGKYYDPDLILSKGATQYYNQVEVGYCNWCNTEHFKCAKCDQVNAIWDNDYGSKIECQGGCGLTYRVERAGYHDHDGGESTYTILKDTETCAKCGDEYEDDGGGTSICQKCENEYAYGVDE